MSDLASRRTMGGAYWPAADLCYSHPMQFHLLVDEIRHLSLPEKEEMKTLLDKYLMEERRTEIARNHEQSLEEHRRGELEFSSDPARLRQLLEA